MWLALSKPLVPAAFTWPHLNLPRPAPPSSCHCPRDGGLARGSPRNMPQASIRAHCLGTDKATDCGPHPSSPDGCGQVQACPLGHCQEMAELTPVAPCQGPGGQPRGDVAWASVGAVGRVGSGFPAPPSLKNRDPRCAWRGHCRGDRAALGVTGAWGLRRGGGGDKGQQTGGWGPEPLASPVKGGHSCRDPPSSDRADSPPRPWWLPHRVGIAVASRLPARIPPQR